LRKTFEELEKQKCKNKTKKVKFEKLLGVCISDDVQAGRQFFS